MSQPEIIGTHIFDYHLIEGGNWESPFKEELLDWVKKPSGMQKENACKIMSSFIIKLLDDDISDSGYSKTRSLDNNLLHLEGILSTTKGELTKKFYRDHINHSIRVLLISRYICENVKELEFTASEKRALMLSALFHDISYPLSEVYEIYNAITKSMKEIYDSIIFPDFLCSDRSDLAGILLEQIDLCNGLSLSKIGKELYKKNHSVMSSLEFLTYIKKEQISQYKTPLNAILLHDPSFNFDIPSSNKIAVVLIIADELQDWGRKSSFEKNTTVNAIDDFKIQGNHLSGKIRWSEESTLSPLRQIFSKQSSLTRIKNNGDRFNLEISYLLPSYKIIDYRYIEKIISKILNAYDLDDLFINRDNIDVFEERYCGVKGIEYGEIEDYITRFSVNRSYFRNLLFHTDLQRKECWLLPKRLVNPCELKLEFNNEVNIKVSNEDNECNGIIKGIEDEETFRLYKIISKELSLLYELISIKLGEPPFRLWPDNDEYQKIIDNYRLSKREIVYLNESEDIRIILKSQGIFLF